MATNKSNTSDKKILGGNHSVGMSGETQPLWQGVITYMYLLHSFSNFVSVWLQIPKVSVHNNYACVYIRLPYKATTYNILVSCPFEKRLTMREGD